MFNDIFDDSIINTFMYNDINAIMCAISELQGKFMKEKYCGFMLDLVHNAQKVMESLYKGFAGWENTFFIMNDTGFDELIHNVEFYHLNQRHIFVFISSVKKYPEVCALVDKILRYTTHTRGIKFIIFTYDEEKKYDMSQLMLPNLGYLDYNTLTNIAFALFKIPWVSFNNRNYMRDAEYAFSCDEKEKTKVIYQAKNYIDCRFATVGEYNIIFQSDTFIYKSNLTRNKNKGDTKNENI